jgi:hypothetical protein
MSAYLICVLCNLENKYINIKIGIVLLEQCYRLSTRESLQQLLYFKDDFKRKVIERRTAICFLSIALKTRMTH